MAIDIIARAMAASGGGSGGSVSSVNGKTGAVVLNYNDVQAAGAVIVTASSNTNINGYSVPNLNEEQILSLYNNIVAGNQCILVDSTEHCHFVIDQADSLVDAISISFVYFDIMFLNYMVDEYDEVSITYKEIASKQYVDSLVGNIDTILQDLDTGGGVE